ncbi:hypothetical protein IR010_03195 [Flavobacterium sp. MR2016-29]|uniref:hypothetical protein n=1 Tax=Flavobacterium sp. MR2016-29 TaxID=2783795 RepID=UPI00188B6BCE|nr:hypothetical protein [Flavobacterium sp. MR2016-29]MBF4491532.1 hypothetical protein [Flavobacterium sp. MR2016-29]
MKKTIFYSWQSDLPNSTNRGFIGKCLEEAISTLNEDLSIDAVMDRDTKNVIGTPDIASSIFNKIDNANIFVADVSFINADSSGKKCPNPNVLIELGYASKALGWDKIICVFNNQYGKIEELPFDLRFRRPISYSVLNSSNKTKDRKVLTNIFKDALQGIIEHDSNHNELQDYLKKILDKEVLTICNHLLKIIYGYQYNLTQENIGKLLDTKYEDLEYNLYEKKLLGFTIFKDWESYVQKLEGLINQPFFIQNANAETTSSILKILKSLRSISAFQVHNDLFTCGAETQEFTVIDGQKMNSDNPKGEYLLLKKIDLEKGIVVDWGKIKITSIRKMLFYYTIKPASFKNYSAHLLQIIKTLDLYVAKSNNEFILDPLEFRSN